LQTLALAMRSYMKENRDGEVGSKEDSVAKVEVEGEVEDKIKDPKEQTYRSETMSRAGLRILCPVSIKQQILPPCSSRSPILAIQKKSKVCASHSK